MAVQFIGSRRFPPAAQGLQSETDLAGTPFRGILYALLASLPIWAGVVYAVTRT